MSERHKQFAAIILKRKWACRKSPVGGSCQRAMSGDALSARDIRNIEAVFWGNACRSDVGVPHA